MYSFRRDIRHRPWSDGALLAALFFLGSELVAPTDAAGQVRILTADPATALARLESGEPGQISEASVVIKAAFRSNYDRYSAAQRQQLLQGVERIARGEAGADDLGITRGVRTAFAILSSIALDTVSVPEDGDIARRMLRIYQQTSRLDSKALSVSSLGRIASRYPAERAEIDSLLFSVASAPFTPDRVHPRTAIDALLSAGDVGLPVLRRLHEQRAVRDRATALFLRGIAERGYRYPVR